MRAIENFGVRRLVIDGVSLSQLRRRNDQPVDLERLHLERFFDQVVNLGSVETSTHYQSGRSSLGV